jgi:ubiquinone/menaquinone biosynthesis C-methylase UbiE
MHEENKKFEPHKADRLISEERFNSLRPDLLLKEIGVKSGMNLADIGCGNGFFSVPAAELVEPGGVVFAIDVSEEMLNKLRERVLPENIQIFLSKEGSFPIEADSVNFVILSAIIHEVENRREFLLEVQRVLNDDGFLWILEWIPKKEEHGPPKNHRVSQEELQEDLNNSGFKIEWCRTLGNSHYHILSKK